MASFAKATKWLLAGDKIKPTEWRKGTYMRFDDRGELVDHAGMVIPITRNLAILDYVRLVPRKPKVDESLYEPVGTVPQVGDTVVLPWSLEAPGPWRVERGRDEWFSGFVGAMRHDASRESFSRASGNPEAARILKRAERNVFTDPRVGDVIQSGWGDDVIVLTVRAVVPDVGILATISNGAMFGYSFPEWAAKLSHYTVKHRAEGGGQVIHPMNCADRLEYALALKDRSVDLTPDQSALIVLAERVAALEAELERVRSALNGYRDSNLGSLAESVSARSSALEAALREITSHLPSGEWEDDYEIAAEIPWRLVCEARALLEPEGEST